MLAIPTKVAPRCWWQPGPWPRRSKLHEQRQGYGAARPRRAQHLPTTVGRHVRSRLPRQRRHAALEDDRGGITAARAERDSILGAKGKGQKVQPNPRLRFGEAADRWLADQVVELRGATQASYRNSVETHLRPRWGRRQLDSITVDDAAHLVHELRAAGKAEWTISTVLRAASRIFTFASAHELARGEPHRSLGERRATEDRAGRATPDFQGDELRQTLGAAHGTSRSGRCSPSLRRQALG